MLGLLKKKAEGKEIVVDEPEEEQGQVLDLMEALEASLAEAKKGGRSGSRAGGAKKSSRAKKSTKKTTKKSSSSRSRARTKKSA